MLYEIKSGIVTIALNRPDVHNAFDEGVIADLHAAFDRAAEEKDLRAVVLRGNGKSFCAGGDLNWMKRVAGYTHDENVKDAMALARLLARINTFPHPVIGLVHGSVFGGGVGLAACCDIVIAEEGAEFCLSEVRVGIIPSVIAPYVVAAIGPRQARRYFMTAERIPAAKALDLGLAHELCPQGGLDAALAGVLSSLQAGAPGAQAMGKALILEIAGRPVDEDMMALTALRIAQARASDEGREGLTAFLEKRPPSWTSN